MLESNTRAWLEIKLARIDHNVEEIRKLIPAKSKIMGIVKANAYGHGDIACTLQLKKCGVDCFGVSSVDEAIHLRVNGIDDTILVLGYTPPVHFHYLAEYNLLQTFLSLEYAKKLDAFCAEQEVCIQGHVKVDTGMSRIGVVVQDQDYRIDDVKAIYRLKHIQATGIYSHFSVSDALDEDNVAFTNHQIELYDRVLRDLRIDGIEPGTTHIQNSYGILNYPHLAYDYVRPGLLYMGVTSNDAVAIKTAPKFLQLMELKANISLVKTIQPDVCVSYGRNYRANCVRTIATVSLGYADGYARCLSNRNTRVLLHGQFTTIIGNICMDQLMIDVSDIKDVKEGDVVTFFGYDQGIFLSVDEITRGANTINNETFCWFSARVPRIYQ